jgi:hypothetical protein
MNFAENGSLAALATMVKIFHFRENVRKTPQIREYSFIFILRSHDQRFSKIGHGFSKMVTDISEVDM